MTTNRTEYGKRWRAAHPDAEQRYKATRKRYRETHREQHNAYLRLWRDNDDYRRRHAVQQTAWRNANPEKERDSQHKKWRLHRDRYLAQKQASYDPVRSREYKLLHRARYTMQHREWNAKHPESVAIIGHNSRMKRRGKGTIIGSVLRHWLQEHPACEYCGSTSNLTIDHVVPLVRGGQHNIGNLARACRSCNSSKNDSFLSEWRGRT